MKTRLITANPQAEQLSHNDSHGFVETVKIWVSVRSFQVKRGFRYRLYKMLHPKHALIVRRVQGSKMYLDLKDPGISMDLLKDGIREPQSTKEMNKIVQSGDVVLDIGANIGYYVLMEAKLAGEGGRVFACEPIPQNVELLKENIALNNLTNVEVFNMALGEKTTQSEIFVSSKRNLHSMLRTKNTFDSPTLKVTVMSVDDFVRDKLVPSIIRMDVEGYENRVVKGMAQTLSRAELRCIFMEAHFHLMSRQDSVDMLETLKSHGFEIATVFQSYGDNEQNLIDILTNDERVRAITSKFRRIDDLLQNDAILDGKKGALEIFFTRS